MNNQGSASGVKAIKGRKKGTPAPNKGKAHRPPSTTISIRIPVSMLAESKAAALKCGISWNRFAVRAITDSINADLYELAAFNILLG